MREGNAKGGKQPKMKSKKRLFLWLIIPILALVGLGVGFFFVYRPMKIATEDYNNSVVEFNLKAKKYNELVKTTCVSNIEGFDESISLLAEESTGVKELLLSLIKGNNVKKVSKDIATLDEMTDYVKADIRIMKQITNPSVEWVEDRLNRTSSVLDIEHVSEGNDPNGLLDKEGGYTGCIYFSIKDVDASGIKGKTIVEKGTDGGGAVEIYSSIKDAEDRCS